MAFQNVGSPRFYVNVPEWANAVNATIPWGSYATGNIGGEWSVGGGVGSPAQRITTSHFYTLPVIPSSLGTASIWMESLKSKTYSTKGFAAFLGHTFRYLEITPKFMNDFPTVGQPPLNGTGIAYSEVVNSDPANGYDGFSIVKFNWAHFDIGMHMVFMKPNEPGSPATSAGVCGSIMLGTYYDMPNAPNLSLTMNREYGSTKEFDTYNGSSMSNTMWRSAPNWGSLGAWELNNTTSEIWRHQALSRSSRRTWDLKFSFMDDSDLWGSNQMISKIREDISDGTDIGDYSSSNNDFQDNLLTDSNFFSQVWHKTLGLTIPMILQPDSSNNSPDQFAIVRGVSNSLKATQSAFNVYDISVSLEEVW